MAQITLLVLFSFVKRAVNRLEGRTSPRMPRLVAGILLATSALVFAAGITCITNCCHSCERHHAPPDRAGRGNLQGEPLALKGKGNGTAVYPVGLEAPGQAAAFAGQARPGSAYGPASVVPREPHDTAMSLGSGVYKDKESGFDVQRHLTRPPLAPSGPNGMIPLPGPAGPPGRHPQSLGHGNFDSARGVYQARMYVPYDPRLSSPSPDPSPVPRL